MTNKINTIDDAAKICSNSIRLVGELRELSIGVNNYNDRVYVSYIGVVKVNDSYIKIYGTTNNNVPTFNSDIERLKSLKANIFSTFENNEVIDTVYSDECSMVYIDGKVSSANSIKVNYISNSTTNAPLILGAITGIPIEIVDDDTVKVLVINNNYHNVMTFKCDKHAIVLNAMLNQTINFSIKANDNKYGSPLSLVYMIKIIDGIPENIIDNALTEHGMYLATKNNEQ